MSNLKIRSDPFVVYGSLKVKVEYCFDCQKWHPINETCSTEENEIEDDDDTLEETLESAKE